ncbi:hypothetical protein WOLCODRAFT_158838 [Wolfiporia cocos MD-104 SS10]|uniref:Uncharacterized protein n=1 Tax=Wolfiporia cocos (strain MD-104) TaxID=742152 RepID=A0A2H3JHG6_WOLCO|nr:hypothetical protein WOLCODRAFT_158838 [Wolfiporia cocos MD-104 SS10]
MPQASPNAQLASVLMEPATVAPAAHCSCCPFLPLPTAPAPTARHSWPPSLPPPVAPTARALTAHAPYHEFTSMGPDLGSSVGGVGITDIPHLPSFPTPRNPVHVAYADPVHVERHGLARECPPGAGVGRPPRLGQASLVLWPPQGQQHGVSAMWQHGSFFTWQQGAWSRFVSACPHAARALPGITEGPNQGISLPKVPCLAQNPFAAPHSLSAPAYTFPL